MLQTLRATGTSRSKKQPKIKKNAAKIPRISDAFDIFDGNVKVYRTTHSGDVWQMRMYVQPEQRYVRKSLKTRDKEVATDRAQKEFIFYQAKILQGEKIFSITAEELRTRYLKSVAELVSGNQISAGRESNIKTHTKHYVDFVGKSSKIQNIDKKLFQGYRQFRQSEKQDITMTAVVNETISIKQMYRWATEEGLIAATYLPNFGRINVRKNEVRRESFTIEDYTRLTTVGGKWYQRVPKEHPNREEEIYYRRLIQDFIVLMGNFGFRTSELLLLKYSDVVNHDNGTATVHIRAETTKVRTDRTVTGRRGDVFKRRREYGKFTDSNDYVFSHFRKQSVVTKEILYDYYHSLAKAVKEKHPTFDDTKTLYSLRHLWITIHLLARLDVYKIARYAGTSLNQIQKHYDNVKDSQVSKEILSVKLRFDRNNEIVLEPDGAEA